jgi:hypothetical protein
LQLSIENSSFDRLYAARLAGKEAFGISDMRCECVGCQLNEYFRFDYNGYSRADLTRLFSTTPAANITISGSQTRSSVSIKNPSGERLLLWNSLGFLRG